jgi:hypothetical protein
MSRVYREEIIVEIEATGDELSKSAGAIAGALSATAIGHAVAPLIARQIFNDNMPNRMQIAFQTQGATVQSVPMLENRNGQDERQN